MQLMQTSKRLRNSAARARLSTLNTSNRVDSSTERVNVNMYDLISQDFYDIHESMVNGTNMLHNWLKGGRGSLKSSYVSLEVVDGIQRDDNAHAVVVRDKENDLRGSVYEQYKWAISMLGEGALWTYQTAPLRIIYNNPRTKRQQYIVFKGANKPTKLKSTKFANGYVKYLHFEEAEEYESADVLGSVILSLLRGERTGMQGRPAIFYTFNPPKERFKWINGHMAIVKRMPDTLVSHTDYRTAAATHPEWLGEEFIAEAETARIYNPRYWKQAFLGLDVATGNEVFENVESRVITREERDSFESYRKAGVDFGFGKDPFVYADAYYDRKKDIVYLWGEVYQTRLKNKAAVDKIKSRNPSTYKGGARGRLIRADSAEPRTIAELYDLGLDITRCRKGKGSVDHGVKWLSDRTKIIIDVDSPNMVREFSGYSVLTDAHGNARGGYPDKDNHTIDAVRYALEDEIKGSGFDYD